ncbi:putative tRNA modification GTPase TrmE [Magnetofaba australis IT-1]|uniref:tRNA modification GTPase MnmE n=1 Tax=Magnetofaba australis IT-1 TaxID=1434232 RepID=A0A1Y2K130_9PROT|nr:putative tRNA modification GTPase TrmE [Magnetofaba australis IT-1]
MLVAHFPAPNSYTGEDVIELQCHGSPVIVSQIIKTLGRIGIRSAEPGEFTRRAVINGKMDLAQAEGVNQLIHARSERASFAFFKQMEGGLSQLYENIRQSLITAIAVLETYIDFEEDADEESPLLERAINELETAQTRVEELLSSRRMGQLLREGLRVMLVGRPNVGKSSLFNAIAQQDKAIVTDIAGTTRDCLENIIEFQGIQVDFIDSAGIRESSDPIERIGIEKARRALDSVDAILFVADASTGWTDEDDAVLRSLPARNIHLIWNKADLQQANPIQIREFVTVSQTSCLTGEGIDAMLERTLTPCIANSSDDVSLAVTTVRQENLLNRIQTHLGHAVTQLKETQLPELAGEELREALIASQELLGQTDSEEIYDNIFNSFCLGK